MPARIHTSANIYTPELVRLAYNLREEGYNSQAIADHLGLANAGAAALAVLAHERRIGLRPPARRSTTPRTPRGNSALSFIGKYGCEIECFGITQHAMADALEAAGIPCRVENYSHTVRTYWKVITDSSVNSAGTGVGSGIEVVSPPLRGQAGFAIIARVMKALREAGAQVDRTCGLHVHHEVNHLDGPQLATLIALWFRHQAEFESFVPESRRSNGYCRRLSADEARSHAIHYLRHGTPAQGDRRSLNVVTYPRQGTFEVRLHQGTLNATKLTAWIVLFQSLIQAAKAAPGTMYPSQQSLLSLAADHGLLPEHVEYLHNRAAEDFTGVAPAPARTLFAYAAQGMVPLADFPGARELGWPGETHDDAS